MKVFRELIFDLETLSQNLPQALEGWDSKTQKTLQKAHDAGYNKDMLKVLPPHVVNANKLMVLEFERKLYNRKFNVGKYEKQLVAYVKEVLTIYLASHAQRNIVVTEHTLTNIYNMLRKLHLAYHITETSNTIKVRFEVYYNDATVELRHKFVELEKLFRYYSYDVVETTNLDTSIKLQELFKTPFV